jgi:hypothetical protein
VDDEDLASLLNRLAQPLGAICALAARREYELAKQYARELPHEQLVELAVLLPRLQVGGLLTLFEGQGHSQEEAREMAADAFRRQALMGSLLYPPGGEPPEGQPPH